MSQLLKKKVKYLVIAAIVVATSVVVLYNFYLIKLNVIRRVPADVSYCISFDNSKLAKEIIFLDNIKRDTLIKTGKKGFFAEAEKIIALTKINPLGKIALFGSKKSYSIAWSGISKKLLFSYLKSKKLKIEHGSNYDYVKINNKYFLCFDYPVFLMSNALPDDKKGFFSDNSKKILPDELYCQTNRNSCIYGFIKPDTLAFDLFKILPLKEKAYLSVNIGENETKIAFTQENIKLSDDYFLPETNAQCMLLLSSPWNYGFFNSMNIVPKKIKTYFGNIFSKEIEQLNFEVLDTITSTEQYITYDMDNEFKLTQKVNYKLKTYPGLYLELFKTHSDTANLKHNTEFFNLELRETKSSYILKSGDKTFKKLPPFYFYANIELLQYDPFWKEYCISAIKKITVLNSSKNKGSELKISITY